MSKGKEFPPRVIVERTVASGMIAGIYLKALEIRPSHGMPEEYLSLEEHSHLLAEARSRARAEALKILGTVHGLSKLDWFGYPHFLVGDFLAKAAEGASE